MLWNGFSVYSQDLSVNLDSLVDLLHSSLNERMSIEIEEIKGVYKLTFWHFVPSLNYDFLHNRYYLTISSSAFVSNMINKRQEKRRLSSIDRRYSLNTKSDEVKLKSAYLSLLQKLDLIRLSFEVVLNDIEIFKIKKQEFDNNEIDTETFLKDKSSILNKIKSHNSEVSDIKRYISEIEILTSFVIDFDFSKYYVSTDLLGL